MDAHTSPAPLLALAIVALALFAWAMVTAERLEPLTRRSRSANEEAPSLVCRHVVP
jgi:hypothetical protein